MVCPFPPSQLFWGKLVAGRTRWCADTDQSAVSFGFSTVVDSVSCFFYPHPTPFICLEYSYITPFVTLVEVTIPVWMACEWRFGPECSQSWAWHSSKEDIGDSVDSPSIATKRCVSCPPVKQHILVLNIIQGAHKS